MHMHIYIYIVGVNCFILNCVISDSRIILVQFCFDVLILMCLFCLLCIAEFCFVDRASWCNHTRMHGQQNTKAIVYLNI